VTELAGHDNAHGMRQALAAKPLQRFKAFSLLLFEIGQPPIAWHWNGRELEEEMGLSAPLSSSSLGSRWIPPVRRRVFKTLQKQYPQPLSLDRLCDFHAGRIGLWLPGFASVNMQRKQRRTQSMTRIQVRSDRIRMDYFPGNPRNWRHQQPDSQELAVRCNTSSSAADSSWPGMQPPKQIPERSFELEQLFREKAPALHARMPRLAFRLLARLVRERQINQGLQQLADTPCRQFPQAVLTRLGVSARTPLTALPPASARPVFVANHPQGGLDGLLMLTWLLRWYRDVQVPVNDVLSGFRHLQPFLAPIDRYQGDRAMATTLEDSFASQASLLLFPAGRTSRIEQGRLQDGPWGKMVARMARRHGRTVVPVFLDTRNSKRFYRVAALRKRLGIKHNLEMLLLVDEMLRAAPRQASLRFGPAISAATLETLGETDQARADCLRTLCYQLAETETPGQTVEVIQCQR